MTVEYRALRAEDVEQAAYLEAVAFYGPPNPERVELLRKYYLPEWTVAAFVDGTLVADVRTVPMARRMNGGAMPFGTVGPVACLAGYRRQGHVGKLLSLSLERMRDNGQAMAGLHTPHDSLYTRYGWERGEAKKRYQFEPTDVRLRFGGAPGTLVSIDADDWPRLEAIYRAYAADRNGPLHRVEPWWRESVLRDYDFSGRPPKERDAFVWVSADGRDEGYIVYHNRALPDEHGWQPQEIWVRDFVALSGNAYLGLWRHLLAHDLAKRLVIDVARDDPFPDLCEDPSEILVTMAEGAMIRIVDVERAIGMRRYCGDGPVAFTMAIADSSARWNEGVWRVQATEGRMSAERTDSEPDVELTANVLATLVTGHVRPDVAAGVGLLKVRRPEVVQEMAQAFAVTYAPFCNDYY